MPETYSLLLKYLHEVDRDSLHASVKKRIGQLKELDDESEIQRLIKLKGVGG